MADQPDAPVWLSTERVKVLAATSATSERTLWDPVKSLWLIAMVAVSAGFVPMTVSASAIEVFLITTAVTICAGHSVGMHRLVIHHAFRAPKWLERLLIWLGVLVGMAGPFGMM